MRHICWHGVAAPLTAPPEDGSDQTDDTHLCCAVHRASTVVFSRPAAHIVWTPITLDLGIGGGGGGEGFINVL